MKLFLLFCLMFCFASSIYAREYIVEKTIERILRDNPNNNGTKNVQLEEDVREEWTVDETGTLGYSFASGLVSHDCMRCICMVESNCRRLGCRMDVGSLSCGYFQIKEAYWIDCGKPGKDWKSCAMDLKCASGCVQRYMARYARHYGCPATCEGYAREHNGGPRGCKNPRTVPYWERLQRKSGCRGVRS